MLKFDSDVTGEPAPTVTWGYKEGKVVNDRITIENEPNVTSFLLKKAERFDSGIYKITAKNDSGTDVAELDLVVLGQYFDFPLSMWLIFLIHVDLIKIWFNL